MKNIEKSSLHTCRELFYFKEGYYVQGNGKHYRSIGHNIHSIIMYCSQGYNGFHTLVLFVITPVLVDRCGDRRKKAVERFVCSCEIVTIIRIFGVFK